MKQPIIIFASVCIASAGFVAWRVQAMRHHTVNHYESIYDPSLSFTGGCQALVGTAEKVLSDPGLSAGSTLTVLALGDASTADEPWRMAEYTIPMARKVIEGRRASVERQQRLLQDLWVRCRSVRPTLVTPIYLGVTQAIADLRADGCKEGLHCELWVSTDLEENGVRAIKERIRRRQGAREPLPEPLDNSGIAVTFCGFAQTAGRLVGPSGREIGKATARGPHRDDRLQAVWRSLFTHPELVRFEPYCPEPNMLPANEAATPIQGRP
jgi:hypothetical protein